MMTFLPPEIQQNIWKYDPTFYEYFSKHVLPNIRLLRCKQLAADYYKGSIVEYFEHYFRFYENCNWYRAYFEEISYKYYIVTLFNERLLHLHCLQTQNIRVIIS